MTNLPQFRKIAPFGGLLIALCLPLAGCVSQETQNAPPAPRLMHPAIPASSTEAPAPTTAPPVATNPAPPIPTAATLPDDNAPYAPLDADAPDWDALPDTSADPSALALRFNAEALREHDQDFHIIRRGNSDLRQLNDLFSVAVA